MWVVAAVALLLGAYVIWSDRLGGEYKRRARLIEKTPTTKIAEAMAGQRVEIKGLAQVAEEGVIAVPGGSAEALYYSIRVDERRVDDKGRPQTQTILHERRGVPFLVDDGSGRHARVDPTTADLDLTLEGKNMRECTVAELHPDVRALVEKAGELTVGPSGRVQITQLTIVPGDPIYALGIGELVTRQVPTGHYRGSSAALLVLKKDGERDVLLGNTEEQVLYLQRLYQGALDELSWKGIALFGLGIAIAVWLIAR